MAYIDESEKNKNNAAGLHSSGTRKELNFRLGRHITVFQQGVGRQGTQVSTRSGGQSFF
jgi:hypothetical protein